MRNETLLRTEKPFNSFTLAILQEIRKSGFALVTMRNETIIKVYERKVEAEEDSPSPYTFENFKGRNSFIWDADGSSITSSDFDLIEFEES